MASGVVAICARGKFRGDILVQVIAQLANDRRVIVFYQDRLERMYENLPGCKFSPDDLLNNGKAKGLNSTTIILFDDVSDLSLSSLLQKIDMIYIHNDIYVLKRLRKKFEAPTLLLADTTNIINGKKNHTTSDWIWEYTNLSFLKTRLDASASL